MTSGWPGRSGCVRTVRSFRGTDGWRDSHLASPRRDRYNKPVFADTDEAIEDVLVAPALGDEVTGSGDDTSSARITLYFGTVVGVAPDDQFTVRGDRYKVLGNESDWSTGFSHWNPGSLVQLTRTEYVDG
jgi:hypothetical protein